MTAAYVRLLIAVLSAALPLLGSCGCSTDAAGRYAGVGTGGSLGNVGPGASVHVLALNDGLALTVATVVILLTAAVGWLLYKHQPQPLEIPTIVGKNP